MPRGTPKISQTAPSDPTVATSELAAALVQAINSTKPVEKKNPFTRKVNTPWTPKDGSKKLKLKRAMYQHGRLIDEAKLSNQEIDLCNKVRTGRFLDNYVTIYRRKDRGIDIDYATKTASQKLRLVNQFGVRNLSELLQMCIDEALAPKKSDYDQDGDAI